MSEKPEDLNKEVDETEKTPEGTHETTPKGAVERLLDGLGRASGDVEESTELSKGTIKKLTEEMGGDPKSARSVMEEVSSITEKQKGIINEANYSIENTANLKIELSQHAKDVLEVVMEEGMGLDEYARKFKIGDIVGINELLESVEKDIESIDNDYEMSGEAEAELGRLRLSLDELSRVKVILNSVKERILEDVQKEVDNKSTRIEQKVETLIERATNDPDSVREELNKKELSRLEAKVAVNQELFTPEEMADKLLYNKNLKGESILPNLSVYDQEVLDYMCKDENFKGVYCRTFRKEFDKKNPSLEKLTLGSRINPETLLLVARISEVELKNKLSKIFQGIKERGGNYLFQDAGVSTEVVAELAKREVISNDEIIQIVKDGLSANVNNGAIFRSLIDGVYTLHNMGILSENDLKDLQLAV